MGTCFSQKCRRVGAGTQIKPPEQHRPATPSLPTNNINVVMPQDYIVIAMTSRRPSEASEVAATPTHSNHFVVVARRTSRSVWSGSHAKRRSPSRSPRKDPLAPVVEVFVRLASLRPRRPLAAARPHWSPAPVRLPPSPCVPNFFSRSHSSRSVPMRPNSPQLAPTRPNSSQLAPTRPNSSQLAPTCPNLPQLAPTCPNLSQLVPICPNLSQFFSFVPICPNFFHLSQFVPICPNLSQFVPICPN